MTVELDIGPLSRVKGEIDLGRRAGEDASRPMPPAHPGTGWSRRASMHQAHGALAIVGIEGITEFADAIEQLLGALADASMTDGTAAVSAAQGGFRPARLHPTSWPGIQTSR